MRRKKQYFWLTMLELLFAFVSAGTVGYTGRLGGVMRHSEFHGSLSVDDIDAEKENDDGQSGRGKGKSSSER